MIFGVEVSEIDNGVIHQGDLEVLMAIFLGDKLAMLICPLKISPVGKVVILIPRNQWVLVSTQLLS